MFDFCSWNMTKTINYHNSCCNIAALREENAWWNTTWLTAHKYQHPQCNLTSSLCRMCVCFATQMLHLMSIPSLPLLSPVHTQQETYARLHSVQNCMCIPVDFPPPNRPVGALSPPRVCFLDFIFIPLSSCCLTSLICFLSQPWNLPGTMQASHHRVCACMCVTVMESQM